MLLTFPVMADSPASKTLELQAPAASAKSQSLAGYLQVGPVGDEWNPAELLQQPELFTTYPQIPAWGFSDQVHWLRFRLAVEQPEEFSWLLEVAPAFTDHLTLYWQDASGHLQKHRAGDLVQASQRPLNLPQQVFPLELKSAEQVFLLRVEGTNPLFADAHVWESSAWLEASQRRNFYMAAYLAILALMTLLGTIYSLLLKNRAYSYYTLYVSSQLGIQISHSGYLGWMLDLTWTRLPDLVTQASIALSLFFFALLFRCMTGMAKDYPRFSHFYLFLAASVTIMGLAFVAVDSYAIIASWMHFYILALTGFSVIYSLLLILKGRYSEGSAYLVIFGALALGVILRILREQALLPNNFWTENAMYLGTLAHLLVMQIIIALKINRSQEDAKSELQRLSRVASETTNGVIITDATGCVQWVNQGFSRMTGYALEEVMGSKPGHILQGPETDPECVARMRNAIACCQGFDVQVVNYHKDSTPYWVSIICTPIYTGEKFEGHIAIQTDITEKKRIEENLNNFKYLLDNTLDCVLIFDAETFLFSYANEGALRQLGFSAEELFSLHPYDIEPNFTQEDFHKLTAPLFSKELPSITFEAVHQSKEGKLIPVEIFLQLVRKNETAGHFVAITRDIEERKRREEKLRHMAMHDALTDLPNRTLFMNCLKRAVADTAGGKERGERLKAVLLLDLDNFKLVNDSLGHHYGDGFLIEVANRLGEIVSDGDVLARLGGDEFGIILTNIESIAQVHETVEQIFKALKKPILVNGQGVAANASIGFCLCPEHSDDPATLMRYADVAMYAAKASGRGNVCAFRPEMEVSFHERLHMLSRLKKAIDEGGFHLHYQPQVDVVTGDIVGAEALIRWNDSELGPVGPDRFIALAEMSGLILPLGEWVLDHACQQIGMWYAEGLALKIAVNLSPQQLLQDDLQQSIVDACKRHGCPVHLLELEITESTAMQAPELTDPILAALAREGFSLALDDFGTGHSSLSRISRLSVTKLKIDRSFIVDMAENPLNETLVRMMINLGSEMGMRVVAEGVETQQQRDMLATLGCHTYQGWLFSKALPPERFLDLCKEQHASTTLSSRPRL